MNMITTAIFAAQTKTDTKQISLTVQQISFTGFGWHGDELHSSIDLQDIETIPAEFRTRYYITLENFTGLKLLNYKPQCDFDEQLSAYRKQASWTAKPLQEKLIATNPTIQLSLTRELSSKKTSIKIVQIKVPGLNRIITASTKTDLMEKFEAANLDCSGDFVGSIAQSEYTSSPKLITCEATSGYGTGAHSVSYSFNFYNSTVTDNTTGEISKLTTQASGKYAFDDSHVGIKVLQQLTLPSLTSDGPINGSVVIGHQVLTCYSK